VRAIRSNNVTISFHFRRTCRPVRPAFDRRRHIALPLAIDRTLMHASLRARGCIVDIYYRSSAGAVAFVSNTHTHRRRARCHDYSIRPRYYPLHYDYSTHNWKAKCGRCQVRSGRVGAGLVHEILTHGRKSARLFVSTIATNIRP